ncbi:MAG: glycosyltransferase [Bacteroidota bacterium]
MTLSIIIVNYNVQYFLEQCLLSVEKAIAAMSLFEEGKRGEKTAEVFVVDNNSVDNSVAMVREKFPEIKLIANKKNTGFAVANNQAIKQAKGKYILLLNPDTVVREDTFKKCVDFMETHADAGGLGVKMIDGSGNFLPESKRGFPSPFVAFAKTFGLSKIFPKSKLFNRYHLGFLNNDETHKVDVLAGAFMLMRKSVLDEIGLLDEAFFMYGEDIDLSYRIVKAGYQNYYFADTTIIHYKGESTKKGSLNYVRTFYNAMIIFAKKHFQGNKAKFFIASIYAAIYFRAGLTVVSNFFRKAALPLLDALLLFGGLVFIKYFWARYYYDDPGYYDPTFVFFNIPFYTALWLGSVFFTGGYDERYNLRRLVRGLVIGTILISAVYGYLPLHLRPSRAIVLLGAVWAVASLVGLRMMIHFLREGNFNVGLARPENMVIVGSAGESQRVQQLLLQAQVRKNFIGNVSPQKTDDTTNFLADISRLDEVAQIYKVEEVIFCSHDVSAEQIMHWMTQLGSKVDFKIVPKESISIIGSSSKDSAGELYTIDIRYKIATAMARRNKRVFDVLLSVGLLLICWLVLPFMKRPLGFLSNIFKTLTGKKTWVGYATSTRQFGGKTDGKALEKTMLLPSLRKGVLSPLNAFSQRQLDGPTIHRLNFLYAKDYNVWRDLEIIWKGFRRLGS